MTCLTLSCCALGLRPARRRRRTRAPCAAGDVQWETEGDDLGQATARLLRLRVFETAELAESALFDCPELASLSERSLARRLVTLRTLSPARCNVLELLTTEPWLLSCEEASSAPSDVADEVHEARTRGCLEELSFLPDEVLAVCVTEDPTLLRYVGVLRQGDLRKRWEGCSLVSMTEEERRVEYGKARFEQFVRNFIF